jgi:hypothetical protein
VIGHPTHIEPATAAALLAESRRRGEALRHRRDLAQRIGMDFEALLTPAQVREREMFLQRMREGALRRVPSAFLPLEA